MNLLHDNTAAVIIAQNLSMLNYIRHLERTAKYNNNNNNNNNYYITLPY